MRRELQRQRGRKIWVTRLVLTALLALSHVPASPAQSRAQRKAAARDQYERAEKLRTALNGKPQKSRTLAEYRVLVRSYRAVYLITPHAVEVTAALLAVAEIYQEMGRLFDPKYYQAAIDAYQFLLHEYPTSRFRDDALFTIGQIQQSDLNQLDAAELTFQDFVKRFPRSPKAGQAQRALADIVEAREAEKKASDRERTARLEQRRRIPQVTNIRYWNAENYTRIVLDVEEEVKFDSARISNPDRIYFDLSQARLSSTLAGKTFDLENGFLKKVRVAQNQTGVVRLVLEVEKVKDYSVFLLPNPYRLVVDVYGQTESAQVAKAEKKTETGKAAEGKSEKTEVARAEDLQPPSPARATRNGQHSLTRALGLKIGKIVIDAGHGGHDTGTIGPSGLMEKDLCLDIALRLGKMIQEKIPGAEVIHTRQDDTFIPLENRTALANQVQADMFISIHANSSRDRQARGVETYYLNFAASEDAMEVAARENALSQSSIHELQDMVKKIANNEKIEESRELAIEIQEALAGRLRRYSRYVKDRGVKRAPFVVLIGAKMPSILAEVSFLSNPYDEQALKTSTHRDRVVEGLYRGVETYLQNLNSLSYNQTRQPSEQR